MKRSWILLTALSLLLSLFALPALADGSEEVTAESLYLSFTGTVGEVAPAIATDAEGQEAQVILLENEEGTQMEFLVTMNTLLLNEPLLESGQALIAFFDGSQPITPERPALVLTPYVEAEQVVMAYFDADLLSDDGMLQLTVDGTTEILDQAGDPFEGDLGNHVLVVVYGPSTRSIPAQTTPAQIVVMDTLVAVPVETK